MIDIIKSFIDLIKIYINSLFYLKIDLTPKFEVYLGVLVIAFLFIVFSIYFIFKALGIFGGDD